LENWILLKQRGRRVEAEEKKFLTSIERYAHYMTIEQMKKYEKNEIFKF